MRTLLDALLLGAGYNAALVGIGAALLGFAAGAAGTFLFLRKRALVSDAMAHATLPGIGLAFILMVALGGDGRALPGLLAGSALTGMAGLMVVDWMTRRTRLGEDVAIGAVLSVFFGLGVVLLTVIQSMSDGRQAGLESFLLGSTAGMLLQDAVIIAGGGLVAVVVTWALRRPMTLVAFDPDHAETTGIDVRRIDLAMMGLALAVTVIGLKIVGLILIVAMLIIPPVVARFWTDRTERLLWMSGGVGAVSGYVGAALSASAPALPTGPIIVLVATVLFAVSFLFAPGRGVLAAILRRRRFRRRILRRGGLLTLAREGRVTDPPVRRLLRRHGLVRADGAPTATGRTAAAAAARDDRRWQVARAMHQGAPLPGGHDGLMPVETAFTPEEIAELDRRLDRGSPA